MRRWLSLSPTTYCYRRSLRFSTQSSSSSEAAASARRGTNNYYNLLGVPMCADQEEIKRAYFRKCKEFHPDLNLLKNDTSKEFQQIQKAYDVLRSPTTRESYDASLKNGGGGGAEKQQPRRWVNKRDSPYSNYYQMEEERRRRAHQWPIKKMFQNKGASFWYALFSTAMFICAIGSHMASTRRSLNEMKDKPGVWPNAKMDDS